MVNYQRSSFSEVIKRSFEIETLPTDHKKIICYKRTYLQSNFRRIYRNSDCLSYRGSQPSAYKLHQDGRFFLSWFGMHLHRCFEQPESMAAPANLNTRTNEGVNLEHVVSFIILVGGLPRSNS